MVLVLSILRPAKSASEYPINLKSNSIGYHSPRFLEPYRYLNILLIDTRWGSLGSAWNLAHKQVAYIMPGLLVVKYSSDPIIPLYVVFSTGSPMFGWILVAVAIGVVMVAHFCRLNLFRRFLVYFVWLMKTLHFVLFVISRSCSILPSCSFDIWTS